MEQRDDIPALVEHQFRHSFGDIVASLTRMLGPRYLSLAEDAAQEALVTALRVWPFTGPPRNPAGWLHRVARNRAIDSLRSAEQKKRAEPSEELLQKIARADTMIREQTFSEEIADDRLRLIFMCCHPVLSDRGRIALTLRLVSGFSVAEIAAAMLARDSTVAQQIVRAKRTLRRENVDLEVPSGTELPARLDSVLTILYLGFNGGYAAPGGEKAIRRDLCDEALRLTLALLEAPVLRRPETHALAALFYALRARFPARLDAEGVPVTLPHQDRSLWDRRSIKAALQHQRKAVGGERLTRYHLEAAIAVEHSIAPSFAETNWRYILELYDDLMLINPSPVTALNRVVALAHARDPVEAMAELKELAAAPELDGYYLVPAAFAALHEQMGEPEKAAAQYKLSRDLCGNRSYWSWFDARADKATLEN